jgi:hypothetical protein
VGCITPELAQSWRPLRKEETAGRRLLTYCGGCTCFLGAVTPTVHILDLMFDPDATIPGKVRASRAPFTYWNRIRLKARFKRMLATTAVTRERTYSPEEKLDGIQALLLDSR